ncbi:unnamed protein product [Sphagnum jensenii]|uniref:Uncharacterized protein n=1 Tax=Sphagnum jensenii TaxID=128206 RepID=A0ABP1BBC1_9BRYO
MQVKRKAAIDVVCNPLGKSGGAARSLDAQFTPLVQKDLKGKLLEGKLSAISDVVLGQSKARKEAVAAVAPAPIASTTNRDGSTEKQGEGERDIPASEPAPIN